MENYNLSRTKISTDFFFPTTLLVEVIVWANTFKTKCMDTYNQIHVQGFYCPTYLRKMKDNM